MTKYLLNNKLERLRSFLKEKNLKQIDLARSTKRSHSTISQYLAGNLDIPYDFALSLQAVYHLSAQWLTEGAPPMYVPCGVFSSDDPIRVALLENYDRYELDETKNSLLLYSKTLLNAEHFQLSHHPSIHREDLPTIRDKVELLSVRLCGDIAAGEPIEINEWNGDMIDVPKTKQAQQADDLFALRIKGDSMIGKGIYDGEIAIFKKSLLPINGDIVAARIGNRTTLKQFFLLPSGSVKLRPFNPEMKDILLERGDFYIEGVLINTIKRFK